MAYAPLVLKVTVLLRGEGPAVVQGIHAVDGTHQRHGLGIGCCAGQAPDVEDLPESMYRLNNRKFVVEPADGASVIVFAAGPVTRKCGMVTV